ncbi:MAG: hypothetical protein Q8O93_05595 [bacterium]|nr:hypothetical protein [bacterium]
MKKLILLAFLALLLGGCSLTIPTGKSAKKILKPEEARAAAEKFINENLLPSNVTAVVNKVTDEGDVYNIDLNVAGTDYTSYMTKDGTKFFQSGIDIASFAQENSQVSADTAPVPAENIPKSDKPKVELFVMTHCPYGLQAEKGFLPAVAALGDKVDAKVEFVHYFLHGDKEEDETYNQVCIREEQQAKYNDYLNCFIASGDSVTCQNQTGLDKNKLSSCVSSKAKDYYKSDSVLSQQYGVQGSPTLVINGAQSSAGRDAASYLAGICAAFNNAPAECSAQLSSASPATGFGSAAAPSGASAAASCEQ